MTGFYKKCNTGVACFSQILLGPIWKLCPKYECMYEHISFAIKSLKKICYKTIVIIQWCLLYKI